MRAFVYGIIEGTTTSFPLDNPDLCETGDIECPIQSGKVYDMNSAVDILKSYPQVCNVDISKKF